MQPPQLTPDQIQERCTEQSFTRGLEYFHAGAIGNPTLHGYTLSATCEGTDIDPYRLSVELMPTGIATTGCSCPIRLGRRLQTYCRTSTDLHSRTGHRSLA